MDSKILDQIKQSLLEEKTRLEAELNRFTIKDELVPDNYKSEFPKYGDSEDDNAAEVADYTDNLSIEHALEKQLKDVNKALENIENGSYGGDVWRSLEVGRDEVDRAYNLLRAALVRHYTAEYKMLQSYKNSVDESDSR